MTTPTLVAVAHGTREQRGLDQVTALVDRVARLRSDVRVELCWLDIATPSLTETLAVLTGPAVVVPLLLSTGYHVTRDIPSVVADRGDVVVSPHLGPDDLVVAAVADRLREARTRAGRTAEPGGPIVLIAAGSSEPAARTELEQAATRLAGVTGQRVTVGQLSSPEPFADAGGAVEAGNYMLAAGYFSDRLTSDAPCAVVAAPIADHPLVAELILRRYEQGVARLESRRTA